ncbi:MAG: collagen-like protein [Oscillospiraceae bacterium]|nr:collagen-like protein [Oscillospiraceae bacterium]
MPQIDLGSVVGPRGEQGATGPQGTQGIQGIQGVTGKDATINGVNALTLTVGGAAHMTQDGSAVKITAVGKNLLHNWYFANCVNQRGQTEYTEAGYIIDRWKMGSTSGTGVGAVSIRRNEYVSVDCTAKYIRLTQTLDDATIVGKKAVLSILAADGLHSNTLTIGASSGGVNAEIATLYSIMSGDLPTVILDFKVGAVHDIIAVKLELGSTQTLAHQKKDESNNNIWVLNEIPDYGEELAKCQRYQCIAQKIIRGTTVTDYRNSGGGIGFFIPLSVALREKPAIVNQSGFLVKSATATTNSIREAIFQDVTLADNGVYAYFSSVNAPASEDVVLLISPGSGFDANL